MNDELSPRGSAAAKNAASDVLLIGRDQDLLKYREQVLRWAELTTHVICLSPDQDIPSVRNARVAILCHSLSVEERRLVAARLRSGHPRMRIIALDTHARKVSEPARYDDVLDNLTGPEALIRTVRQHLQSAAS
jgi:hypothetical protein